MTSGTAYAEPPHPPPPNPINRICELIGTHAERNGLPKAFLARLIWKESRFDANAESPAGAQGIAQFMPGTAKLRDLTDPFDVEQAIPASAAYLGALKAEYGNLGLAAAAYNAGESRVSRWLSSGGFLPLETEEYVLDILGEPVDAFAVRAHVVAIRPLDSKLGFEAACRDLPAIMSTTIAMATIAVKPWGVQVAGNFRRTAAIRQWQRVKSRFPVLLSAHDPVVSRVRTPMGRRGIYAVRIGVDNHAGAEKICDKLRRVGGACVVVRNR
ncbi:lytic transglycosylase domain-containing protein [Manganibacter manganicus]|uniref:Lytic transglycosylase n=1 Tax=Manganibacter manganicus TaxID=1873176 RepID=A0A1V8RT04_9HYPH|nr:lytic transglycosylase domain-containing protein [Pseudaminobacter manganicus]OQM76307.1 lytic transglycosylase [Pseudaminobacter manganicus]